MIERSTSPMIHQAKYRLPGGSVFPVRKAPAPRGDRRRWPARCLLGWALVLAAGCSKPDPAGGALRWDGREWRFPDGAAVTCEAIAARGNEVLEIDPAGGATVGDSAFWLDAVAAAGRRLRIAGGPEVVLDPETTANRVAFLLEASGGRFHLLLQPPPPGQVALESDRSAGQIEASLKAAMLPDWPCVVALPDAGEPFTAAVEALRISQAAGARPVGIIRRTGVSLLTPIMPDPKRQASAAEQPDDGTLLAVRVNEAGKLWVGDLQLDEAGLENLLRGVAKSVPEVRLGLHGSQAALFKHARRVTSVADACGVTRVAFTTHPAGPEGDCEKCRKVSGPAILAIIKTMVEMRETELAMRLPAAVPVRERATLEVTLTRDGRTSAGGVVRTIPELGTYLAAQAKAGSPPEISVVPAADVPVGVVIELINELSRIGIHQVSVAK